MTADTENYNLMDDALCTVYEKIAEMMARDKVILGKYMEEKAPLPRIAACVERVNNTINLLAGDDDVMYYRNRYRVFESPEGKIQLIRGKEFHLDNPRR